MKTIKTKVFVLLIFIFSSVSAYGFPGVKWEKVARDVGINPIILYAVALAESALHRDLNMTSPWPYALRIGQKSVYPISQKEAEILLNQALLDKETYMIDIGIMQINLHWHGHRVNSPAQLLDPITNLSVGAKILSEAIKSSPNDLELGIGRYHSWNEERARWYGKRVLSIYRNILHELEVRQ